MVENWPIRVRLAPQTFNPQWTAIRVQVRDEFCVQGYVDAYISKTRSFGLMFFLTGTTAKIQKPVHGEIPPKQQRRFYLIL